MAKNILPAPGSPGKRPPAPPAAPARQDAEKAATDGLRQLADALDAGQYRLAADLVRQLRSLGVSVFFVTPGGRRGRR